MVIDTHVHVWELNDRHQPPPDAVLPPPRGAMPVELLVEDMRVHGVAHAVLVLSSAFGWDNTYMVECLERFPGLFRAIGLVDPLHFDNAHQLREWMARGLSGFRLHPRYYDDRPVWVDSAEHDGLWRAAADTGAILQFHMRPDHAEPLRRMIARHPDVRVIVDHMGAPDVTEAPEYASYDSVLRLADSGQVWVKIGDYQIYSKEAFPWRDLRPIVARLRDAFGPERMVWGTGYAGPGRLVTLPDALQFVRHELPLSHEDVRKILGETPRALFGF